MADLRRRMAALDRWACAPIDGASVGLIRAAFGVVLAALFAAWLLHPRVIANLCAEHRFPELGLTWLPLPSDPALVRGALVAMALCALGLAVSRRPRLYAGMLGTAVLYTQIADASLYSSTYYLIGLFCLIIAAIPLVPGVSKSNGADARSEARTRRWPAIPRWGLLLLRFQLAVVYGFAAIAKLDGDWLAGRPLASWLSLPMPWLPEPFVDLLRAPWVAPTLAWGGLLLDGLIVPLLLWRRTRALAFIALVVFHSFNGVVLHVFPLPIVATVLSTVFFDPGWPRRFGRRLRLGERAGPPTDEAQRPPSLGALGWTLLLLFVATQLALPLRHHALSDDVAWSEAGATYAWRLRARDKRIALTLRRVDAETGRRVPGDPWARLTPHQIDLLTRSPEALGLYARRLAAEATAQGRTIELRVNALVALNGRPFAPFIADVDLAAASPAWGPPAWVLPSPRTP